MGGISLIHEDEKEAPGWLGKTILLAEKAVREEGSRFN
jgi:hypothetical protein